MPELEKLNTQKPVFEPGDGTIVTYFQESAGGLLQLVAVKPDGDTQVVLTSIKQEDAPEVPAYTKRVVVSKKSFSVKFYVSRYDDKRGESEALDLKPYVSCGNASGTSDTGFRYDFYYYHGVNSLSNVFFNKGEYGVFKLNSFSAYGTGRIKVIVSYPDAVPGEIDITLHRDYSNYERRPQSSAEEA